jgi:hypothetical protein
VLLLVVVAVLVAGSGAEAAYCRLSTARPARTFYRGEPVRLSLQAAGPTTTGTLTIRDYYGQQARRVGVTVGRDVPRLLGLGDAFPWGIYYLHFEFSNGETQDDAFCVIPRPDEQPGDYGPFSWRLGSDESSEWAALAQAGCRLVRRDLDWPHVMPTAATVDLSKARTIAGLAQQYGMQLIPILGYSPGWAGMRPANAADRSAAAHTWAPETTTGWRQYVQAVVGYLGPQTVAWPASATLQPQSPREEDTLPLVHSWEIWNEADQNFYYGYWGRYIDLLRVASGEIKRQDPGATVLYGGSCGHWTELGLTYKLLGQFFFDRLAFHPGGDNLDQAFETYFCGSPQIGNGYGLYHPATMTEAYPTCPPGVTESQYLLRLYATLEKWQLDTFCTFDGGRVTGSPDPNSSALLWQQGPDLVPNAKYVVLAVARYLLSNCVYVGPLDWGEGVQAYVFLRGGYPLVIAWAATTREVTFPACAAATAGDELGRLQPLAVAGGQARVTLGPAPQVLRGLGPAVIADAVTNQANIFLLTPQGFPTTHGFGYIAALEYDAKWAWSGWPAAVRGALTQATNAIVSNPVRGGPLLGLTQTEVNAQIARTLRKCQECGGVSGRAQSTIWRLETFCEWLGAVTDSYNQRWGRFRATPAMLNTLGAQMEALGPQVQDQAQGLTCPLGLQSLERARASLQRARALAGQGAFRAARGEYNAARLYQEQLPPILTGVVAAPDFVTATQLVKSLTLRPGQEHQVRCYVHNFTPRDVSGVLTLEAPQDWAVEPAEPPFAAPAGGTSEPVVFRVTVPGPPPWVTKPAWTSAGTVYLRLPESMDPGAELTLGGKLSDGRALLATPYPVLVGELSDSGTSAARLAAKRE